MYKIYIKYETKYILVDFINYINKSIPFTRK